VTRAEHHREDDIEGAMEAADRVRKRARVFSDSGSDPWMRQLQQQGTTSTEEEDGFPINPPCHRGRTENALNWSRGVSTDDIQRSFEFALGYQLRTFR